MRPAFTTMMVYLGKCGKRKLFTANNNNRNSSMSANTLFATHVSSSSIFENYSTDYSIGINLLRQNLFYKVFSTFSQANEFGFSLIGFI